MSDNQQQTSDDEKGRGGSSQIDVLVAKYGLAGVIGAALLGLIGVTLTAFLGYQGIMAPIRATMTAEAAHETAIAAMPSPSTTSSPRPTASPQPTPSSTPTPTHTPEPSTLETLSEQTEGLWLLSGSEFSHFDVGDQLVVYDQLLPDTEVPVGLLRVVARNPSTLSAQLILLHPERRIFPQFRVDDDVEALGTSQLVPAYSQAVGYFLGNDQVRLSDDSGISVGAGSVLEAVMPVMIDGTIVDYVSFEEPILMTVEQLGNENVIADVALVSGSWPDEGTIVLYLANRLDNSDPADNHFGAVPISQWMPLFEDGLPVISDDPKDNGFSSESRDVAIEQLLTGSSETHNRIDLTIRNDLPRDVLVTKMRLRIAVPICNLGETRWSGVTIQVEDEIEVVGASGYPVRLTGKHILTQDPDYKYPIVGWLEINPVSVQPNQQLGDAWFCSDLFLQFNTEIVLPTEQYSHVSLLLPKEVKVPSGQTLSSAYETGEYTTHGAEDSIEPEASEQWVDHLKYFFSLALEDCRAFGAPSFYIGVDAFIDGYDLAIPSIHFHTWCGQLAQNPSPYVAENGTLACNGSDSSTPQATPTDLSSVRQTAPDAVSSPFTSRSYDFLFVPGGSFEMGRSNGETDELPVCEKSLDEFWIGRTEVTNKQYMACVDAGICDAPLTTNWFDPSYPIGYGVSDQADYPFVGASWYDARDFCEWMGGRLPTEAEWEYAARGPENLIYPWGNDFDGSRLNYCDQNCHEDWADQEFDDGYARTSSVGSYPMGASWVGALDMAGNAPEWVNDWYNATYYSESPAMNPSGPSPSGSRVLRGGGYWSDKSEVVSTDRTNRHPGRNIAGFRCASDGNPN